MKRSRSMSCGFTFNDNADYFPSAAIDSGWGVYNPILLSTASELGFNTNNLAADGTSKNATVWTCPNRPSLPATSSGGSTFAIGYQFFGGVTFWLYGGSTKEPSASPIKSSTAKPAWMLASDLVLNFQGSNGTLGWSDPGAVANSGFASLPAHKHGGVPTGGNEVFADGAVAWIKSNQMRNFYNFANTRKFFFYQADLRSYPSALVAALASGT